MLSYTLKISLLLSNDMLKLLRIHMIITATSKLYEWWGDCRKMYPTDQKFSGRIKSVAFKGFRGRLRKYQKKTGHRVVYL